MRSFISFSGFHLHAMYQFARTSQEIERQLRTGNEAENRSFALGAIVSRVGFLEANINEFFMLVGEEDYATMNYRELDPAARAAMRRCWEKVAAKASILDKYNLALTLNHRKVFNRGNRVYQDADSLVRLRNEIVHYRTGFRPHPDPDAKSFEKRLKGKFEPCIYYKSHPGLPLFPHRCLGAGCAAWAVKSAHTFANEFHAKLGVAGHYQSFTNMPELL